MNMHENNKINIKIDEEKFNNDNNKSLNEPMIIDDDASFAKKKEIWEMIVLLCPELADVIIASYNEHGPGPMSKAKITIDYRDENSAPA